jgi:hypothetical protein
MKKIEDSNDLLDDVVKLMTSKMLARDFDEALDCAIFARLLSRNDPNPNPTKAALTCIRDCASELSGEPTKTFHPAKPVAECSFCGQKPPAVRLCAGPGVFICNECIGAFAKTLGAPTQSTIGSVT